MSADNWAMCPICLERANVARNEAIAKVAQEYGKTPLAKWLLDNEAANKPLDTESYQTFREDWEVGIDGDGGNGWFLRYSGYCEACQGKYERNEDVRNAVEAPKKNQSK